MAEINNFITDLLDEMSLLGYRELFLNSDQEPKFASGKGSYADARSSELVDEEELIEDMEALSLVQNDAYYYRHVTDTAEESILAVAFRTGMDNAVANFRQMEDPSGLLKGMLDKTNPLPAKTYNDAVLKKLKAQQRSNLLRSKAGSK